MSRMTSTSRARGRPGVAVAAIALAIGALASGACSSGGRDAPAVTAGAPGPIAGTTPRPTEVPGPPVAAIDGGVAGSVPGELGTFLWDGLGSDSPWIVPPGAVPVAPGAQLAVTLDPRLAPIRWSARWAPVRKGLVGDPAAVATGAGPPSGWWRRCRPAPGGSRWSQPSPGAGAQPGIGASAWVRRPACRPDAGARRPAAGGGPRAGRSARRGRSARSRSRVAVADMETPPGMRPAAFRLGSVGRPGRPARVRRSSSQRPG